MTHEQQSKPNGARDATPVSQIPGENEMVCHGQPLNEDELFLKVCRDKHVPPRVLWRPHEFSEDRHVAQRAAVLKTLRHDYGWTIRQLKDFCALSERAVWGIFKRKQCAPSNNE